MTWHDFVSTPVPLQRQRPASASNTDTEASKDKQGAKQGQGDSTLSLTAEEVITLVCDTMCASLPNEEVSI